MNTPVSFPLAKLLKEKGFNKPSHSFYVIEESEYGEIGEFITNPNDNYPILDDNTLFDTLASAPIIADVVMWIYEKHGIWITVCVIGADGFGYWLHNKNRKRLNTEDQGGYWYSPTEAYEAAIKHTLKNLI